MYRKQLKYGLHRHRMAADDVPKCTRNPGMPNEVGRAEGVANMAGQDRAVMGMGVGWVKEDDTGAGLGVWNAWTVRWVKGREVG